jgi:hypothetical protein
LMVGVSQDLFALRFDHVAIGEDNGLAVKHFLNGRGLSSETGISEMG